MTIPPAGTLAIEVTVPSVAITVETGIVAITPTGPCSASCAIEVLAGGDQ